MKLLQQFEILLKVMDRIGQIIRLLCDLALIRGKSVSVDAVSVEDLPVFGHVATVFEVGEEGLADWDVIRSSVVVELLMPLLIEMTGTLRNVMAMHDVQDLISHALAVARAFTDKAHDLAKKVS